MLNVALTGNIAAGKSTVVALFRRWGATIIDADALAREAQAPGTDVLAAIATRFGADVLAPDGSLDRAALRSKVMSDERALSDLNRIVHPAVQRHRQALVDEARRRGDVLLVNDIPLLFEALDPALFDVVVLVDAPVAVRRARLLQHRGLAPEDADRMIAAQMPAERKRPRSHVVLDNDGTLADLETRARAAFEGLRRRAARQALGGAAGSLVIATADARDELAVVRAVMARYADAGVAVHRATGKTPTLLKALQSARPAGATLATPAAATAARAAWDKSGRPGALLYLGPDPDPVAVRLDLRPWGHAVVLLSEEGDAGLPPRADCFAERQPSA